MTDDYTTAGGSLPSTLTAKEVLILMDQWAKMASTAQTNKLWDVLTALRGPDKVDAFVKKATTAVIRRAAVPNLTRRVGADISNKQWVDLDVLKGRNVESHFQGHIENAVRTLELSPPPVSKLEMVSVLNQHIDKAKEWNTSSKDNEARILTAIKKHIENTVAEDPA